jgi:hypothetical protein
MLAYRYWAGRVALRENSAHTSGGLTEIDSLAAQAPHVQIKLVSLEGTDILRPQNKEKPPGGVPSDRASETTGRSVSSENC